MRHNVNRILSPRNRCSADAAGDRHFYYSHCRYRYTLYQENWVYNRELLHSFCRSFVIKMGRDRWIPGHYTACVGEARALYLRNTLKTSPRMRRTTPGIKHINHWYGVSETVPNSAWKRRVSVMRIEPNKTQRYAYRSLVFENVELWNAVSLGNRRFNARKMFISDNDMSAIVWPICDEP